ncbi:MAG: hypothetical protein KAS32_02185, partial [Candidatus Peribacteraceae bacterium]|nr:hypothetical protein [Candidatus Peribacteraceae bacterium]
RNIMGAIFGPTVGTVTDAAVSTRALATGDLQKSDIHAMRKMLPMQNLFYWRRLLNSLEEQTAESLGVAK